METSNPTGFLEKQIRKQIQALIADIDKRQNSAMFSTTAASKLDEIVPNRCIDSATRARIFMQEYQKKEAYYASPGINRDNKDWRSDVQPNATVRKMQDLKDEKDRAFSAKNEQQKKLIQETIKTNRAVALAKKRPKCPSASGEYSCLFQLTGLCTQFLVSLWVRQYV